MRRAAVLLLATNSAFEPAPAGVSVTIRAIGN